MHYLNVRQGVSIHPIRSQTVDVLLPGQSHVVIATARDVHCEKMCVISDSLPGDLTNMSHSLIL